MFSVDDSLEVEVDESSLVFSNKVQLVSHGFLTRFLLISTIDPPLDSPFISSIDSQLDSSVDCLTVTGLVVGGATGVAPPGADVSL